MDLEFDKAASRLKKEQKARVDKEKQRREREKRVKDEADKKNAELEEIAKERRAEQLQKEAEEEERLRLERDHIENTTGGVDFCEVFRAVSLTDRPELSEGDRVTLPVSALNGLQFKGAMDLKGLLTFELTTPQGGKTHAGVIEFVADEGTIGLPRKVQASLGAITEADDTVEGGFATRVTVRFKRLPPGTFVRLQPHSAEFSCSVQRMGGSSIPTYDAVRGKWVLPGLEGVLHEALQPLCCLSVGDLVAVPHGGHSYDMIVLQVEPAEPSLAVTLIDTDIQVEIAPSKTEEDALQQHELQQTRQREEEEAEETRRSEALFLTTRIIEDRRSVARSRLTAEPAADSEGVIAFALRLPDGQRLVRRILKTAKLQHLLDFLDADSLVNSAHYILCTTFPRRVLSAEQAHATFEELGLVHPQESLIVEPL
eukprot:CAMPEP_0179446482 /NCGR_PEP_ID=MMETSP0799-20121207/29905_1 /TAXON_ID=46947 /ORGANISM="Geminigera cryophila, Strain CCMP2564" /LENGTH=426 /DNA_ID=CAMNT_0021235523 /DNA_START=135 /DNA_END=1415 /DNA_ORIENTATION=+